LAAACKRQDQRTACGDRARWALDLALKQAAHIDGGQGQRRLECYINDKFCCAGVSWMKSYFREASQQLLYSSYWIHSTHTHDRMYAHSRIVGIIKQSKVLFFSFSIFFLLK
jgi:hypothetical protein